VAAAVAAVQMPQLPVGQAAVVEIQQVEVAVHPDQELQVKAMLVGKVLAILMVKAVAVAHLRLVILIQVLMAVLVVLELQVQ
jgi:hypothetical protein